MEREAGAEDNILNDIASAGNAYKYSFYRLCREVDRQNVNVPRIGKSVKPAQEKIRFGQEAFFDFSPTALREASTLSGGRVKVLERFLGLFGPQGPMPLQFTDYVRSRSNHFLDSTIADFLDIFHHRAAVLFFRSWAIGRAEVSCDRADDDYFGDFISCLIGMSPEASRGRDALRQNAKLFFSGSLAGIVKSPQKLVKILNDFFGVKADLQEFVGKWYPVPQLNLSRLGCGEARLGESSLLGEQFFDGNLKFRIRLGVMGLKKYLSLLPSGENARMLFSWVKHFFSAEYEWDIELIIEKQEVPVSVLGGNCQLGWTSWLKSGEYQHSEDQNVLYNLSGNDNNK